MAIEEEPKEKNPEAEPTYESVYANNHMVEISFWDLKVLFGQVEQHPKFNINYHTAVTMPWAQAKLLGYYLRLQVAWHEAVNGEVKLPSNLVPNKLEATAEDYENMTPEVRAFWELASRLHREVFGS